MTCFDMLVNDHECIPCCAAHVELVPGGQTVLITSKRDGNTSRVQMTHIGIRLEEFSVIVCKGCVGMILLSCTSLTVGKAHAMLYCTRVRDTRVG